MESVKMPADLKCLCAGGLNSQCNFEFDLCSWRQCREDNFDWLIKAGSTPTGGTGPSTDHTLRDPSGHYIYLESSFPQSAGDIARISGPTFSWEESRVQGNARLSSPSQSQSVGDVGQFIRPRLQLEESRVQGNARLSSPSQSQSVGDVGQFIRPRLQLEESRVQGNARLSSPHNPSPNLRPPPSAGGVESAR